MIDRTIPYHPVIMMKRDMDSFPRFSLKDGYSFEFYTPETGKADWIQVQFSSKQIEDYDSIGRLFDSEFMDREEALPARMLFVKDAEGKAVASASLWHGSPFGDEINRIHWVATDEAHQGNGLCRAMLTRLMDRYHELGGKGGVYLISQTLSYPAISIYQSFGFQRYMGPEPVNWHVDNFEETARKAWKLIDEKIGQYKKDK